MFLTLLTILGCCAAAAGCLLAARPLIHWFQLESYQFPGYFRTLRRQGIRALMPGAVLCAVTLGMFFCGRTLLSGLSGGVRAAMTGAVLLAAGILLRKASPDRAEKKKLAFTPRLKRLYAVCGLLWTVLLFLLSGKAGFDWMICLFVLALPLLLALGGLLAWPLEKAISELYFRDAQRVLREHPDLIRIGITGSWGKTSVKFILGALLEERFPVLVTPASFNTPMGVTKVIRTQLEPGHRIFVAEMGARHVGDIREMCRLVHPVMGILTSVGPQHLDTFHTQERVTKTKYELIEALPGDGCCFFADDAGIVRGLWERTEKEKYLTGLDSAWDDVWVEDLQVTPTGSRFLLCRGQEKVPCETELLGELNIRNIALCASVCWKLGMTGAEIARGIRKLRPVEHRLELKRNAGGINVLDDAFNSNIRGARQAFETLKAFPEQRIAVTPGMVELGDREEAMNREFGMAMAGCCDQAVLVGRKRSEAISAGLREGGFPEENIHVVANLAEAQQLLAAMARPGDTVLFENDLPDNYEEE